MMPEGWKVELIENIAQRCSGHTPSKSHPEYWNGGIKWISLSDSSELNNGYIYNTSKEISDEGLKNSSAVIHPKNTVVLSRDAGVGNSAIMAEPMAVSQHFIAWKCNESKKLHHWYLYYWLRLNAREFERQAVGSTIKTIGLPFFKKLKILLPPLAEQKKIAEILSTWDDAIQTTEKLIECSRLQKKALMQQLLTGKKRLPGFSGAWKKQKFSKLLNLNKEKASEFYSESEEFTYISISDVTPGKIGSDLEVFDFDNAPSRAQNLVRSGNVLMSTVRPNLKGFAMADDVHDKYVASTGFCVLSLKSKSINSLDLRYLYFYLFSFAFDKQVDRLVSGSNYPALNNKDVAGLIVFYPPIEEQQAIAEVLNDADREIELYEQKLEALKLEKKALMQQLLTGKRRVIVDESVSEGEPSDSYKVKDDETAQTQLTLSLD